MKGFHFEITRVFMICYYIMCACACAFACACACACACAHVHVHVHVRMCMCMCMRMCMCMSLTIDARFGFKHEAEDHGVLLSRWHLQCQSTLRRCIKKTKSTYYIPLTYIMIYKKIFASLVVVGFCFFLFFFILF